MFLFYRLHIIHEVLLYKNFILALQNGMILREILATLLLQQGTHPKIVSERLGHQLATVSYFPQKHKPRKHSCLQGFNLILV
jgi:hypothetical protein